jgi:hypothetical protein
MKRRKEVYWASVLALGTLLLCSVSAQGALISQWTFEELLGDGKTVEDQIGNVDLVNTGGASIVGGGQQKFGSGALKSELGYCAKSASTSSYSVDSGTFLFWIKDVAHDENDRVLFTHVKYGNYSTPMDIQFDSNNRLYVYRIPGGGTLPGTEDSNISDGLWHMVALTYDRTANQANFYVDGILIGTRDFSGTITNTGQFILSGSGSWGNNASCYLDNAYYYDTALTQAEIISHLPEPGTMVLLAVGGLGVMLRKKK